jgi:hypothetical protein
MAFEERVGTMASEQVIDLRIAPLTGSVFEQYGHLAEEISARVRTEA